MRPLLRALPLLLLALLAGLPNPIGAQTERSVSWDRLDLALDLQPDGTVRVLESERVRFVGSFQRAYREIPLDRVSSLTEFQVGEPGQPYRVGFNQPGTYAVSRTDNAVRIDWWFPPTANATRDFEISYRASGAVRVYSGGDQLWWVAVPGDLPGPVARSEVVLHLPVSAPVDQLRAEAYLGGRPAETGALSATEARFVATDLRPGQTFEARLQFPHGLVQATAPAWQAAYDRAAWWDSSIRPVLNLLMLVLGLALLVGGPLAVFFAWYARGRDPTTGRTAAEVDAPPDDLPPALAGTIVDEQTDVQDAVATLLDLANRGIVRVTELNDGPRRDYRVELLEERPLGLRPFEQTVVGALFGPDREIRLSEIRERWTAGIPRFKDQVYTEAVERGLFVESPAAVRRRWRTRSLLVLGFGLAGALLGGALLGRSVDLIWVPFAALALAGLVGALAAPAMPRRTRAGAVEAAGWRAFAAHLRADRRRAASDAAEELSRYLPYATALGVDRSWLEKFEAVQAPPTWTGGGPPIIVGPGGWGYPGYYGPGPWGPEPRHQGGPAGDNGGWVGPDDIGAGGLNNGSARLSDLLNAAAEALSRGGGGGWSGGGGGGGGGSGGGSAGFG